MKEVEDGKAVEIGGMKWKTEGRLSVLLFKSKFPQGTLP